MNIVKPQVFMVGYTQVDIHEVQRYLIHTKQEGFLEDFDNAMAQGISGAEALCSMFGKLCYKSLVVGKNANVRKIREIRENIIGTLQTGHGSVFEHASFNMICADVSRVFTHELVRHRTGTAFSQTSGRYCRPIPGKDGWPAIDFVFDPILDPVRAEFEEALAYLGDVYLRMEAKLGLLSLEEIELRRLALSRESAARNFARSTVAESHAEYVFDRAITVLSEARNNSAVGNFDHKKKLTSALRRILPNGQANEIAFSANIRTMRHCVQIRTQRFAEWEIREVFAQIYQLIKAKFPMVFCDAQERMVDGLPEIYGMKLQPYDLTLEGLGDVDLLNEAAKRDYKGVSQEVLKQIKHWANSALLELTPA